MNYNKYIEIVSFVGYDKLRRSNLLDYKNPELPLALISRYFSSDIKRQSIDYLNEAFISKYIQNENIIEGAYSPEEKEGFQLMYQEMLNTPTSEFEIFSLCVFNRILFSKISSGNIGGAIRSIPVYLPNSSVDISEPSMVFNDLIGLEDEFNALIKIATIMRDSKNYDNVIDFIKRVVIFKCKLIKIHPFMDGNGRSIRCFINRIFIEAGIPPVYIRKKEKEDYIYSINEALRYRNASEVDDDSKYSLITSFYLHKICDSIVQLDVIDSMLKSTDGVFKKKI